MLSNSKLVQSFYSTSVKNTSAFNGGLSDFKPAVIYNSAELQKDQILLENSGKCGIYRWTNLINKKTYVGSAIDLRARFYVYYSINRLNSSNMAIYKAILKYGYSEFSLEILEYCDLDKVLDREQYYVDLVRCLISYAPSP